MHVEDPAGPASHPLPPITASERKINGLIGNTTL